MGTPTPFNHTPTVQPAGWSNDQLSSSKTQLSSPEVSNAQTQTSEANYQANTGAEQSTGKKVLDGSIKAANWLIWGDIGGKKERERKKKEKRERRKKKKKDGDDDDEGDWIIDVLEALV